MPAVSGKSLGKSDIYSTFTWSCAESEWQSFPLVDLGHVAVERTESDPFHSLEHKALVNDELLKTEKVLETRKRRSLEGECSEICAEDPDNLDLGENPRSLELANGGSLRRRF